MDTCRSCGIGQLCETVRKRRETYLTVKGWINEYYSECNSCGQASQSSWQIKVNKDNHLYFHILVEGKVVQ